MARKRKRKKRGSSRRWQIIMVCGVKRRICRDAKGRIRSSKAVGKRKTKRKSTKRKRKCKFGVSKTTGKCLKRRRARK